MVGFFPEPSPEEDPNQVAKLKISKDPSDSVDPKTNDITFADSFLDFDSMKEWFEDNPNLDKICLEDAEFGNIEKNMEIGKANVTDPTVAGSEPKIDGLKPIDSVSELFGRDSGCPVKVEEKDSKPEGKVSSSIEVHMGKVSLVRAAEDDDDGMEEEKEENKEKVKLKSKREVEAVCELEEGEIECFDREMGDGGTDDLEEETEDEYEDEDEDYEDEEIDKIFSRSGFEFEGLDDEDGGLDNQDDGLDDEDDDAGAGANAARGPIKKNELEVLPPVPLVDVSLEPHHQMQPVGVVLSIIDTKVIVEGREEHNPLNEGSILWIEMNRSPLGWVDEIFGPVTNPYYVVRYNSESEVPAGIHEGTLISFVPEFANHVLNDKNLHKKGYDASGENDEELSEDNEFSDDEKEAEYKKMLKMSKRGMNDQRVGNQKSNKKKGKSRDGAWKNGRNSAQHTSATDGQLPPTQNQHNFPTVSASLDSHSLVGRQNFVGGSSFVQPFSVMPQSSGFIPPSNGVWTPGMPSQQPQNPIYPNRFPAEGMALISQNYQQQPNPFPTPAMPMPYQQQQLPNPFPNPAMPMPLPYQQQQFNPNMGTLPSVLPGGQSNIFSGPASAPWLGIGGQNGFSQTSGVSMQGQQLLNAVQGMLANGAIADGTSNVRPEGVPGNFQPSQNFNMANGFSQQQLLSTVQGILANGAMADGNCNVQPRGVPDNLETSQNFNMGASSGRGKKPYHRGRGRGRFMGRRGHQQSE